MAKHRWVTTNNNKLTIDRTRAEVRRLEKQKEYENRVHRLNEARRAASPVRKASGWFDRQASRVAKMRSAPVRFQRAINPSGSSRPSLRGRYGRVGRPPGTVDARYAAYGGVYGWRKHQAAQLAIAKAQARQQAGQAIRGAVNQLPPQRYPGEQNTIPNTQGVIRQKTYHDEINDAANVFP